VTDWKTQKVKQRWQPKDDVENQGPEKFRENNLPVADRRCHERLNRAHFKFLGKKAHRDEGENQDERKPEENRIKKRFLD
jgi:hypothetical protein